jgi:hypothetical protein
MVRIEEEEADAVAVFRPRVREKLTPFLDLDDENDESDGLYAEALDDGSFLVHTFQPFSAFQDDPDEALEWLSQFGDALPDVHDDPRGLLVFPDSIEPEGRTYDEVVAAVENEAVWVTTESALGPLMELAGKLATDPSSFEIGQMLTGLQEQMMTALGAAVDADASSEDPDDDVPNRKTRK